MPEKTFGEWLKEERKKCDISLRSVAHQSGISAPYLSDVENDRRVPSEKVIEEIAEVLQISSEEIANRSGRIGDVAERYIKRNPEIVRLIRTIARENWPASRVRELSEKSD